MIALAILNYRDKEGHFPPPYIADENGKPMHSWRVLILPYLEETALYNSYNFDEPWDGPNNRKLHDVVLDVYRCPSPDNSGSTNTNYAAVVGPGTIWEVGQETALKSIPDGASKTILVVEVGHSGIHWMEPRDLYIGQMSPNINPKAGQGISGSHKEGANVVFADGSLRFLSNSTPADVLAAFLTRDGQERIPEDDDW
jgi:prepilin-type processing-associated H-X9-DG protein